LFNKNYSRRALNEKGKTMNFEKLASNLKEEEKKLESQISSYCNPKEIAHEIMSRLEKKTPVGDGCEISPGNFIESGALYTSYKLWDITTGNYGYRIGPLVNCSNKYELAQVVLNSVKKYITDDVIKLDLNQYDSTMEIIAIISRADVEKIKKMNSRSKKSPAKKPAVKKPATKKSAAKRKQ
jgi:hypothetical protein